MINTSQDLKDLLFRINRKSYPAYKDTKGSYRFPGYVLSIDHVQGDPFAAPSKLSLHIKGAQAGFPEALYATQDPDRKSWSVPPARWMQKTVI